MSHSGSFGIRFSLTKNATVKNCYVYRSWTNGIMIALVENGIVNGNIVDNPRYKGFGPGAGIEITGGDVAGKCKNIDVTNNTVFNGAEGIGIYKKAEHVLVAKNTVYDCISVMIYVDASGYVDILDNIVYSSANARE